MTNDDNKFIEGMYVNNPHENAPEFIISNISFEVDRFTEFLKNNAEDGKLRAVIKLSKAGKQYISVDAFKPKTQETKVEDSRPPAKKKAPVEDDDDGLPF